MSSPASAASSASYDNRYDINVTGRTTKLHLSVETFDHPYVFPADICNERGKENGETGIAAVIDVAFNLPGSVVKEGRTDYILYWTPELRGAPPFTVQLKELLWTGKPTVGMRWNKPPFRTKLLPVSADCVDAGDGSLVFILLCVPGDEPVRVRVDHNAFPWVDPLQVMVPSLETATMFNFAELVHEATGRESMRFGVNPENWGDGDAPLLWLASWPRGARELTTVVTPSHLPLTFREFYFDHMDAMRQTVDTELGCVPAHPSSPLLLPQAERPRTCTPTVRGSPHYPLSEFLVMPRPLAIFIGVGAEEVGEAGDALAHRGARFHTARAVWSFLFPNPADGRMEPPTLAAVTRNKQLEALAEIFQTTAEQLHAFAFLLEQDPVSPQVEADAQHLLTLIEELELAAAYGASTYVAVRDPEGEGVRGYGDALGALTSGGRRKLSRVVRVPAVRKEKKKTARKSRPTSRRSPFAAKRKPATKAPKA